LFYLKWKRQRRIKNICVGFEVPTEVVMNSYIFWDITPRNPLKINRNFRGTAGRNSALFVACSVLVSDLAYSSTLKMEATLYSETSIVFQRTTRLYTRILEDRTLQQHFCVSYFIQ
jgi:hypothetical protein